MANPDVKFGFRPSKALRGGTPHRMGEYTIASAYDTSIFSGDLVRFPSTKAGLNIELVPAVTVGTQLVGVFAGCMYTDATGDTKFMRYWPADTVLATGTTCVAYVYDDPDMEFVAQISTFAATNTDTAYGWTVGTGNTSTGTSGAIINAGQVTAANTVVKVTGLGYLPDGITPSEYGANAFVRCRLNDHYLRAAQT